MDGDRELTSYELKGAVTKCENAGCPADVVHADDQHSALRWSPSPPRDRNGFEIAIICALPLEASAVSALFDKWWDDQKYSKAPRDSNEYSTGVIGRHNVVLVHMPNMGKVAAATTAAFLRVSFPGIKLALVVGICGGAPFSKQPSEDILLGDVVISEGLIQYDLGRRFHNNRFVRKDTPWDNLPRPSLEIRAALAKLQAKPGRSWLQNKMLESLKTLQEELSDAVYPGAIEDRLFKSTYRHKHHESLRCERCANDDGSDEVCDIAVRMSCKQLKCDEREVVPRCRVSQPFKPVVHFGLIASGDTVMKSGEDRDGIAAQNCIIAFEMEGAGVWEKFPSSLVIKGVCDYADSHKSKRWQGYAAATAAAVTKGFLENWYTDCPRPPSPRLRTGEIQKDPARREKEIQILKWLDKSPYRDRKERNPDRIQGTCEWFVTHKHFRDWQESRSSSMLWVSADPGCGKSVLAKYLVDSVLATTESRTTCYFFFKDDFEDQRSVVSALCCLLRQIFMQKRILFSEKILELFESEGDNFTSSFSELWAALLSAAEDKNAGEIVCLLDAIDECEDHGRSQLTKALCKLYGTKRNFNLKFLLTSRPYGEIRRGFQPLDIPGLPVIHLSGESDLEMKKISREIDVCIKARVHHIRAQLKLTSDEQDLLLQRIMRVPNRTYLWVHLTLDLIESDIDIDKVGIVNATSHLPQTVDEAYNNILSKSRDSEKAERILHIVVAAARPLTVREMTLALAIRENHQSYSDLDLKSEDRFRESIRDICGLFVTIIDSRIYLLHQTAKEFLVKDKKIHPKQPNGDLKWKHLLRLQDSHRVLTEICMRHLLFAEFEAHPPDQDAVLSQYIESHVFLDYSAKHWTAHLRESHMEFGNAATQTMLRLCDARSNRCLTWFMIYWTSTSTDFPENFTVLMIASYFGLTAVLKHLLELNGIILNSKDGTYGRSALSWAAGNGFDVAVNLLIKGRRWKGTRLPFTKKAEVNSVDKYGRTPLVYAVWNRHVATVKLLLKAGARINLKDEIGGTALSYAVCYECNDVLKLLLKKGTKVDSEDDISGGLLLSAASKGHEAVVKLLLETGKVNPDLKDENGRTPLSLAAFRGHEAVVKLLLETGKVNPDLKDENGQTPLSLAAYRGGDGAVVKLLLETGKVNPDLKDENGQTPLSWAAFGGHKAVVKLLLETGKVNPDLEDKIGRTPLSWAVFWPDGAVVKLLLETGKVNPDLEDKSGRTPRSRAAGVGNKAVVKLLLEDRQSQS